MSVLCFMNTVTHETPHGIPLVVQVIAYVAIALSVERQVESFPIRASVYIPCSCPPSNQVPVLIAALRKKKDCAQKDALPNRPDPRVLKYPIGMAADELESGGYRYG